MTRTLLCSLLSAGLGFSQAQPSPTQPSIEEQQDLMRALSDGQTSPVDLVRALEAHLKKYPNTVQREDLERRLTQASIDSRDIVRIVKYGEPQLQSTPGDLLILDRVTTSLLAMGGKDHAERAYKYARMFEDVVDRMQVQPGKDADRQQDERDRALGRALLYQSRARVILGENDDSERLTSRSFSAFPSEESAHAWADALLRIGRQEDAIARLAEAFTIPDPRATDAARLDDRLRLGELYAKLHGSEKGLGDLILSAYDRTSTLMETRRKKLLALDPNSTVANPLEFTLTGLDGKRFRLGSLKGKLIILDFWATWCAPCRIQHPMFETLHQRFGKRSDVVFLEINADEDRSLVEPFLDDQKWDKTVYFDDGLSRLLSVADIPSTTLLDKSGRLASRMDGFDPATFVQQMTERIESILAAP